MPHYPHTVGAYRKHHPMREARSYSPALLRDSPLTDLTWTYSSVIHPLCFVLKIFVYLSSLCSIEVLESGEYAFPYFIFSFSLFFYFPYLYLFSMVSEVENKFNRIFLSRGMANGLRVLKSKLYKIFSYCVYMEYHILYITTFYISQ